jgi:hypothetical protein
MGERHGPCWRGLVVYVAAAALAITLANRVFNGSIPRNTTAQCHSAKAKIQHRDLDAFRWAAPVASILPLPLPAPTHPLLCEDKPLPPAPLKGGLYDRPPPVS